MIRVTYVTDAGAVDDFLCDWIVFNDSENETNCHTNGSEEVRILTISSIVGIDVPTFST